MKQAVKSVYIGKIPKKLKCWRPRQTTGRKVGKHDGICAAEGLDFFAKAMTLNVRAGMRQRFTRIQKGKESDKSSW